MSSEGLFNWQERKQSDKMAHYTTIEVSRVGPLEVSIRFPNHWFGFSTTSNSIRRGELIRLIRGIRDPDATISAIANSIATIITIEMKGDFTTQKEEDLENVVRMIIREAIIFFSNNRIDLKRILGDTEDSATTLINWFRQVFHNTKVGSINELSNYTREELCKSPKVSRDDVIDLERCLAVHGVFLKDSPLPPYHG